MPVSQRDTFLTFREGEIWEIWEKAVPSRGIIGSKAAETIRENLSRRTFLTSFNRLTRQRTFLQKS